MKLDKSTLVGIGLTVIAGGASLAKTLLDKKNDENKVAKAVEDYMKKQSESK